MHNYHCLCWLYLGGVYIIVEECLYICSAVIGVSLQINTRDVVIWDKAIVLLSLKPGLNARQLLYNLHSIASQTSSSASIYQTLFERLLLLLSWLILFLSRDVFMWILIAEHQYHVVISILHHIINYLIYTFITLLKLVNKITRRMHMIFKGTRFVIIILTLLPLLL